MTSRAFCVKPRSRTSSLRDGKPAGVLIGFASEDDWFEYRLATDPRFLRRIEQARASLRAGAAFASKTSIRSDGAPLSHLSSRPAARPIPALVPAPAVRSS
jgi:hypothetical protein